MQKFMPTGVDCFVLIIVYGLPEPFVSDEHNRNGSRLYLWEQGKRYI